MNRTRRHPAEHRPEFFGSVLTSTRPLDNTERYVAWRHRKRRHRKRSPLGHCPPTDGIPAPLSFLGNVIGGGILLAGLLGLVYLSGGLIGV